MYLISGLLVDHRLVDGSITRQT